jgi:hypothetical protein
MHVLPRSVVASRLTVFVGCAWFCGRGGFAEGVVHHDTNEALSEVLGATAVLQLGC